MEEKWLELLKFIAENMQTQNDWGHRTYTSVEVTNLLDKIAELREITPSENGEQFNQICDSLDL